MIELAKAIKLRGDGKLHESNEILKDLAKNNPDDAVINYQCAWSFDVLGKEAEAVPYYEKALQIGLNDEDALGAYIGLGSTYRALGSYQKSKAIFERGLVRFPENNALKTFYAMTLYNLEEHIKAMEILLTCLVQTSNDPDITSYKRAIGFYADKLDKTW
ncbi:tetratricopeptide repeat protein [Sporosarcina sp. ACRSL]|uniref:tetratricopeptide repeat protein n=1 Tax=Sporosarcina sp. ACRSL TaxID=2918215 RepID=UPI001EF443E6|nr:tetratricopeptide repeat protein [Sporosarcina sp. ACRSL]MCG7342625.1 tetratricopeptide repeat protein [Sporosarcina sp. ACRSL]